MDKQVRTRVCHRARQDDCKVQTRIDKQICVPMTRDLYDTIWNEPCKVRDFLRPLIEDSPELFPPNIQQGYQLSGMLPQSKKMPGVRLRQLRIGEEVFSLRPSFVLPYMTGNTDELEHPLLLLALGVPCWVVTKIFGRDDMFWHRHVERLGRNSVVGTTIRDPDKLPDHLVADEHHVDWCGETGYITLTAAEGCVLGVALTQGADEAHLTEGYGVFADEAKGVDPDYQPQTVNTDGWWATHNAFRALFNGIVIILCFLHGFLKIRDRCRKAFDLHTRIWDVYRAETAAAFRERMEAFRKWFEQNDWPTTVQAKVRKLWERTQEYAVSYSHPGCHRTSNLVDRLMNRLRRFLYAGRGLHGHQSGSELRLRGWALLQNFRPYAPRCTVSRNYQSPAHKLNSKRYHDNWLHNLLVSASMAGRNQIHRKR